MIDIIKGEEVDGPGERAGKRHGVYRYYCPQYPQVEGYSRQPLLDACRQLKPLLTATGQRAGLFREGSQVYDIYCDVDVGADLTVSDTDEGIRFRKFRPFNREALKDAAE